MQKFSKLAVSIFVLALACGALSACSNTFEGIAKDINNMSDAITNTKGY